MTLEQLKTAIKALPTLAEREAAQIVSFLRAHFPWATTTAIVLQDCATDLEMIAANNDLDTRPADESWKPRQDTALFEAHPMFKEAFDALDKLTIRGQI